MYNSQPHDFNPYAAGNKTYGMLRSAPNIGAVDKLGYRERDAEARARNAAIIQRLKAMQSGNYMSKSFLGG